MPGDPTVIDLYRDVLGRTPSQYVAAGRTLSRTESAVLLTACLDAPDSSAPPPAASEVWPLISHHTYDNRALFGTNSHDVLPRALTLLLVHDGLVVADPLYSARRAWEQGREPLAVEAVARATSELAQVEALISAGTLRFTSVRPALRDASRSAALEAFGVTPDLTVFTNFAEAAAAMPTLPDSLRKGYIGRAQELFTRFGLAPPQFMDVGEADRGVRDVAAALIEVSWQFAVASSDSRCDIAVRGPLERHLAEAIIAAGVDGDLGPGRHFSRLDLGLVPNVDPTQLSLSDALSIRSDDAFGAFRASVRAALDRLDADHRVGVERYRAIAGFEEAVQDASRRLRERAGRARFKDHLKDVSVPVALGAVTNLTVVPMGATYAASAAVAVSLTTVVWQWLLGRMGTAGREVALRYFSMLEAAQSVEASPGSGRNHA